MGLQHLVVAEGATAVGRGGEELQALQVVQHGGAAGPAQQRVAQVARQHAEGAGVQQELPPALGQPVQDVAGEVGADQP